MLRFLPYLIVSLLILIGVKLVDVIEMKKDDAPYIDEAVAADSESDRQAIDFVNSGQSARAERLDEEKNALTMKEVIDSLQNSSGQSTSSSQELRTEPSVAVAPDFPSGKCLSSSAQDLSSAEVEIFKGLKARRQEIEQKEQEMIFRESTLQLMKEQIDDKLSAMKLLEEELQAIIKQYNVKEDEKSMRLVRVYESMKPKEAARIFEEMQLSVLLNVVDKMRETRLGPILASMEPVKAKEMTVALVNRRKSIHIVR